MNLSPEMIDAAVIQLRMLMENGENIPEEVKATGAKFLDSLDAWSGKMKAAKNAG